MWAAHKSAMKKISNLNCTGRAPNRRYLTIRARWCCPLAEIERKLVLFKHNRFFFLQSLPSSLWSCWTGCGPFGVVGLLVLLDWFWCFWCYWTMLDFWCWCRIHLKPPHCRQALLLASNWNIDGLPWATGNLPELQNVATDWEASTERPQWDLSIRQ